MVYKPAEMAALVRFGSGSRAGTGGKRNVSSMPL
jgi:hypothetical protein